jgi:hypothetical protein
VHTFDLAVALDPDARIDTAAVPVLWARLAQIAERFHDDDARTGLAPLRVTMRPTDGLPAQTLTIEPDRVRFGPGEAQQVVSGPAEVLVRLVYGRLDPDARVDDRLAGSNGADPTVLRTLFAGY